MFLHPVIPAQAGIQLIEYAPRSVTKPGCRSLRGLVLYCRIPACAGMTK